MDKINKNKGYAILFAVVIVGIISLLAAGLSNTSFKQLILSSLVKDSQTAFYKADTASECGLYSYFKKGGDVGVPLSFTCGTDKKDINYNLSVISNSDGYSLITDRENEIDPCFKINVTKVFNGTETKITINSDGYNICDTSNSRSVEREIEIDFDI